MCLVLEAGFQQAPAARATATIIIFIIVVTAIVTATTTTTTTVLLLLLLLRLFLSSSQRCDRNALFPPLVTAATTEDHLGSLLLRAQAKALEAAIAQLPRKLGCQGSPGTFYELSFSGLPLLPFLLVTSFLFFTFPSTV